MSPSGETYIEKRWGSLLVFDRRATPTIGGSQAGFIGLLVGFGVIILGSCIAIFILLRDHKTTKAQRRNRYAARSSPTRPRFTSFVRDLFSTTNGKKTWIQASDDAWTADEAERLRASTSGGEMKTATQDEPFRPPRSFPSRMNSFASESQDEMSAYDPEPTIRYAPAPRPASISLSTIAHPRSASPASSASVFQPHVRFVSSAAEIGNLEEESSSIGHKGTNKERQLSADSLSSIRTFEGGTKFIEGL
ncbi:unnamed protein product [Mycena citricolor]|uniref:Uncharacterized protein n=1 Tax=Mycena citricolor TaxID=2018698 RepID=A0AAD2H864_9AGAR|nr:unnamed protein product [Mycena citricolor]